MPAKIPRKALNEGASLLDAFPAVVIQGARQVGKSTLAAELVSRRPSTSVTLDDQQARDAATDDPRGFVEQHPEGTLVIDELQRLPELTFAIKASIDRDRRAGRFLLTGSSDILRSRKNQDSLAGRVARLQLYGFSQGEREGVPEDFASVLIASFESNRIAGFRSAMQRADYVDRIDQGSFPEAVHLTPRLRNHWFDSYIASIIEHDAIEISPILTPARLASILRLISANQAGELVKARISEQASIPASTITSYLDLLNQLFVTVNIFPWTANLTRREIGRTKSIVLDSGLAMRLSRVTHANLASVNSAGHLGSLLEGFVAAELLKQRTWTARPYELFHYRDRDGVEVDLVMELEDGFVIGLEVKSSTSFNARQFTGLKFLRDKLGGRFLGGVVLNTGQQGYRFADRLWGLPVSALWRLPG